MVIINSIYKLPLTIAPLSFEKNYKSEDSFSAVSYFNAEAGALISFRIIRTKLSLRL